MPRPEFVTASKREVSKRAHRTRVVLCAMTVSMLALAGSSTPFVDTPRLIWNASASAPLGLYGMVARSAFIRGELVLVRPPAQVQAFAAQRGYLPKSVPMVKQIAAQRGDIVCRHGETIMINGRAVAVALRKDRDGRILPTWSGCHRLMSGEVFLLMPRVGASFDSRYFGPVSTSNILGKLVPIWTR